MRGLRAEEAARPSLLCARPARPSLLRVSLRGPRRICARADFVCAVSMSRCTGRHGGRFCPRLLRPSRWRGCRRRWGYFDRTCVVHSPWQVLRQSVQSGRRRFASDLPRSLASATPASSRELPRQRAPSRGRRRLASELPRSLASATRASSRESEHPPGGASSLGERVASFTCLGNSREKEHREKAPRRSAAKERREGAPGRSAAKVQYLFGPGPAPRGPGQARTAVRRRNDGGGRWARGVIEQHCHGCAET